ncbi:amino acid adenylation domain-containing protein [Actinacidiphila yanglinensis]|uniref:Amino acid adenylation domain-containing protein n=1 Tax=Actinacidiphila yanglinensis TaxID=310779 RepID=A0A1H6EAR4_9ACTN|nr:amino acid adenylation domain-containing protein [Actinacidiphila yanglinensis]SEG94199.1 amino acid adenylation domain-containing protein [Actinacidiphila yanglinensis]
MRTIWDVVTEQCARTPEAVAAVGRRLYTYEDVTQRAATLSTTLLGGIPPGSLIAHDIPDPVGAAILMLAAARRGCPVLPLHPDSPRAHRAKILADARPTVVVQSTEEARFTAVEPDPSQEPAAAAPAELAGTAYVMYTSGSTGQPKGVAIPHHALLARLAGLARTPGLAAGESILAMTALTFDISIAELLLPLTVGAHFIAAPPQARTDPDAFTALLTHHTPDVVQATPSFWRLVTAAGWHTAPAQRVWCGGEALTHDLATRLLPRTTELWNLYGPTEATIWATAARIRTPDAITLGHPLPGTGLLLHAPTTNDAEPQEGELLLYGDGLATGYLGRNDLTHERFHSHPTPHGPQRAYHTGDRARRLPNGQFLYLGRTDHQIKLRGQRIELGEIEATLQEHPAITEAVVLLRHPDRPEHAYLEAHITTTTELTTPDLRQWARHHLPSTHHPTRYTTHTALPRTTNGKTDRIALTQRATSRQPDRE